MTATTSGSLPATGSTPLILRPGLRFVRSRSLHMREPHSTGGICFKSPKTRFRKSIQRPVAYLQRFQRPAAAVIRGSRGRKEHSGWDAIGNEKFIKSTRRRGRFYAPSNRIALSPASLGWTKNSGTPRGKVKRVSCGTSILEQERFWRKSKCRRASAFRDSNSMAVICSFAAVAAAGKCEPFADLNGSLGQA